MFVQKETLCGQIQAAEKTSAKVLKDLSEAHSILNRLYDQEDPDLLALYELVGRAFAKAEPLVRDLYMIRNQVFNGWPQK